MGAVFGISAIGGPLLGGLFTDHLSWEWCFWINIPVGIAAFAIAWRTLSLPSKRNTRKVDFLGVVLLSAATTSLIVFTNRGGKQYDWSSPVIVGLMALFVAAVLAFVVVENCAEQPIIPMSLFRIRTLVLATAIGLLGLGMFSAPGLHPDLPADGVGYLRVGLRPARHPDDHWSDPHADAVDAAHHEDRPLRVDRYWSE